MKGKMGGLWVCVGAGIYAAMYVLRPPVGRSYDERVYLALADLWANGQAGAITHRPPLLWVTLGTAQAVGLDPYATAITLNTLACGLLLWAIVALASRLWHWSAGLIVAGLLFAHPVFWYWSLRVLTELPALAIVTTATWALVKRRRWMAGALLGLGALARPEVLGLLPLFALADWLRERRPAAAYIVVAGVLVVLPWTLRNAMTAGRFVPIASNGWMNMWRGSAFGLHSLGHGREKAARPDEMALLQKACDTHETEPYHFPPRVALDALRRNLDLLLPKMLHLWWGKGYWNNDSTVRGSALILVVVGTVGMIYGAIRRSPWAYLAITWVLYYNLLAAIFFPMDRLQLMTMPAFMLGALTLGKSMPAGCERANGR